MSEMVEEFELPCGIKVLSIPDWGDPMLISFADFFNEAIASVRVPNDWEYEFIDNGQGGWTIRGTPIYDDRKPRHVLIKDVVKLENFSLKARGEG